MGRRYASIMVRLALVVLVLGLGLVRPAGASAADAVTRQPLYLRTGPGLEYEIILVVPAGEFVLILDDPEMGWYPVVYRDLAGWIYGGGLAISIGPATINSDTVNLREGPGLDYEVITTLPAGAGVQIIGGPEASDEYTWIEITVPGVGAGWVVADYLSVGEE